ncbi:MAG: ATP-dependent helicase [Candidatus Ancillula sp.]|jgi:DNA helicase-2/ATP-dependent DNA helicase PcrA|nr:ATP-dependent helicase [Candidatus Ancillula sp.]
MYSASDIAEVLGISAPTPQQRRIIEAPADEPSLVIAGAGAGKTETMANRIIFLIANNFFTPDQILGLTFTRKARGELNARIKSRLKKFNMIVGAEKEKSIYGFGGTSNFSQVLYPTILTYNSFAANITNDYGIYYGIDTAAHVLSNADRYNLAKNAVLSTIDIDDNFIDALGNLYKNESIKLNSVIKNMLVFNDNIVNNLCNIDTVDELLSNIYDIFTTRNFGTRASSNYKKLQTENPVDHAKTNDKSIATSIQYRKNILKVIKEFVIQKEIHNAIDFSDQIQLAIKITSENIDAVKSINEQYRAVILDEYQDTSSAQVVMLQNTFKNTQSIMSVGDPNQAIYEWRGASSANILEFPNHFKSRDNSPAKKYELTTSWRNSESVLKVANSISKQLDKSVDKLNAGKNINNGIVKTKLCLSDIPTTVKFQSNEQLELFNELTGNSAEKTMLKIPEVVTDKDVEAQVVADFIEENWTKYNAQEKNTGEKRTAAILCPTRSDFLVFKNELDRRNVPVEVIGIGGLLELPEITDVIALISAASDPEESSYLMRLLVSPRINLGPKDINTLGKFVTHSDSQKARTLVDVVVDSLTDNAFAYKIKKSIKNQETFSRIQNLATMIVKMKQYLANPVPEIIEKAVEILEIENELKIINQLIEDENGHGQNSESSTYTASINLNSFRFLTSEYSKNTTEESVSNFLDWIQLSKEQDNGLDTPIRPISRGAVQIITIHGAKGLEWDIVCSVSNTTKQFLYDTRDPKNQFTPDGTYIPKNESGWLDSKNALPDSLTLDNKVLAKSNALELAEITNRYKYDAAIGKFEETVGIKHLVERRRLAYVAYTRAKSHLLITASLFVRGVKQITMPTPFFLDAANATSKSGHAPTCTAFHKLVKEYHKNEDYQFPTQAAIRKSVKWPNYKVSSLQEAIIKSARAVEKASEILEYSADNQIHQQMKLLLDEYEFHKNEQKNWKEQLKLPVNLSTSKVVQLIENKEKFLENLICQMPSEPTAQSDLGTKFHEWIDSYYKSKYYEALRGGNYECTIEKLKKNETFRILIEKFLKTKWALMTPHITEQEINYSSGSHIITARIDAVFEHNGEYEIVDWKTGKLPHKSKINDKAIQLAIYREAWLKLHPEIAPKNIHATFAYIAEDKNMEYSAQQLNILHEKLLEPLSN